MVEHAGFDAPSVLDRQYEELFGDARELPEEHFVGIKPIWDQGLQALTRMACSRYALGHIYIGNGITEFDCLEFRKRYLAVNPIAEQVGTTIQSGLAQGRSEGDIAGHYRVQTIQQARAALYRGNLIYTGSLDGDWGHVRRTKTYARREGTNNGHLFAIVGYNAHGFHCINSYGEENGYFFMENVFRPTLYSKNAIMVDRRIAEQTQQQKDNESKRIAYKYVMSEARPNDFATREELAIIFGRFIQQFFPDKD